MYKVSVPLVSQTLYRSDLQKLTQSLKQADVQRIFLSIGTYIMDAKKRKACMDTLREQCAFLKSEGFEVGVWVWTVQLPEENNFAKITSIYGKETAGEACPADPAFRAFAGEYIKELATCGVDLILLDDDYRLTLNSRDFACACEHHLRLTAQHLGRPVTRQEIAEAMTGKPNPVRTAFQHAKGESLLVFAQEMRRYLNEVDPTIRMGVCGGIGAWGMDSMDIPTVSRALAGDTKPLLRLTGAPYWIYYKMYDNRLQDVVEMTRLERSWCGEGIEIMAEGDTYPRPRFTCPAAYLEGFDTAVRADGTTDGILKYMVDYASSADYEPGYLLRHNRNQALYRWLEQTFGTKQAAGIRVYEPIRRLENYTLPESRNGQRYLFSYAARMLAANGIPTTYEGPGCAGICFGESARYLSEEALQGGMILDGVAALVLQEKGIDVGIAKENGEFMPGFEHFHQYEEYALADGKTLSLELRPGAQVLSWYEQGDEKVPGSYCYENENGQKFLVLCFDGNFCKESLFRQYTRSRQIGDVLPWLSGEKLPAHCPGNPDLYLMSKVQDGEMAVGLWNFCADEVLQPKVKLHRTYEQIRFIGCTGKLEGDTVTLSELSAYDFCGFIVE